jgi:hypothetical protein
LSTRRARSAFVSAIEIVFVIGFAGGDFVVSARLENATGKKFRAVLTFCLKDESFFRTGKRENISVLEPVKKLAWFVSLIVLFAGCTTGKTYKPNMAAQPPKPAGYPIPLYGRTSDFHVRAC